MKRLRRCLRRRPHSSVQRSRCLWKIRRSLAGSGAQYLMMKPLFHSHWQHLAHVRLAPHLLLWLQALLVFPGPMSISRLMTRTQSSPHSRNKGTPRASVVLTMPRSIRWRGTTGPHGLPSEILTRGAICLWNHWWETQTYSTSLVGYVPGVSI